MPVTSVDVDALYAALNNKRQVANLSWRQLASALGVAPSTFTRMAQGLRPDVDTFATLLRWLNMPAEAFTRTTPGSEAIQTADEPEPMAMISSYLRAAKNISAEDAEALEEILRTAYKRLARER